MKEAPASGFSRHLFGLLTCPKPPFPRTLIYNEGWLLRLALDWFSRNSIASHPLSVPPDGCWYSEALLPSAFLPRSRGDPLGELWTHADAAIGHFRVGAGAKGDLSLLAGATYFVVLEAKLFSGLSGGTSHALYFDQAARTVACMAETLKRSGRRPKSMSRLGFFVLAPRSRIGRRRFKEMEPCSSRHKVERRVKEYQGDQDEWLQQWFLPTWERIQLAVVAWEEVMDVIAMHDADASEELGVFYGHCLNYGHPSPDVGQIQR